MNGTGMYEIEDSYCLIIDAWMSAINQSTWKELSKTKRAFKKNRAFLFLAISLIL